MCRFKQSLKMTPILGSWMRRLYLKLRYHEGEEFYLPNGIKMRRYLTTYNAGYADGSYEPELSAAIVSNLQVGSTFYDVGANAGFFSLLAAPCVGSSGQIIAFEPHPSTAHLLRCQFESNGLQYCKVVEAAVSDRSGFADFSDDQYSVMQFLVGTHIDDVLHESKCHIRVQTVTLDEVVARSGPPALVKIDVEGAEMLVLKGAKRLLSEYSPTLLVELHSVQLREEYHRLMDELGYYTTCLNGGVVQNPDSERFVLSRRE